MVIKTQNRNGVKPARIPLVPAFIRPFFFIIKLAPIKMLEETARVSPWKLSGDNPIDHTRDEEKEEKCKACRAKKYYLQIQITSYIHRITQNRSQNTIPINKHVHIHKYKHIHILKVINTKSYLSWHTAK